MLLRVQPRPQTSILNRIFPHWILLAGLPLAFLTAACTPRVAVEAPKEPITINMNVKIEHEVRIKVDRELDDLFNKNPELF
ncbi:MAG: YnbE family lipoprotein [Rhodospirillales bacterium]|nr:YnbE family lipoprotein [Rhodospirillales bacterium]